MDMGFIQDRTVSHAAGRPKDVVRKDRTENENKISKFYTVSGLRLTNEYQQLVYNKIYLNNP